MRKAFGIATVLLFIASAICLFFRPESPTQPIVAMSPGNVANAPLNVPIIPTPGAVSNPLAAVSPQAKPEPPKLAAKAGELVADSTPALDLPPSTVLQNVERAVRQYGEMFGGNPIGTNPEITSELSGNNPKHIDFITPQAGTRINANGELVDAWGTPYFFHQISGSEMEIHSAGPDKVMWTSDDLVVK
jgi:hypothetical protein